MVGALFPVPLYTPSLISALTTIRAMGDRGLGVLVVPALVLQPLTISAMRRGRRYAAENDFNVGKIGSGIGMELYIERNYVGQFVGGNVGTQIAVGVDGYVNWS